MTSGEIQSMEKSEVENSRYCTDASFENLLSRSSGSSSEVVFPFYGSFLFIILQHLTSDSLDTSGHPQSVKAKWNQTKGQTERIIRYPEQEGERAFLFCMNICDWMCDSRRLNWSLEQIYYILDFQFSRCKSYWRARWRGKFHENWCACKERCAVSHQLWLMNSGRSY